MATVTVCQQEQVMPVCHLIVVLVSWGWSHSRAQQMGCKRTETEMTSLFVRTENSNYQRVHLFRIPWPQRLIFAQGLWVLHLMYLRNVRAFWWKKGLQELRDWSIRGQVFHSRIFWHLKTSKPIKTVLFLHRLASWILSLFFCSCFCATSC